MTVIPSFGVDELHLGQSGADLRARFGEPASIRRSGSFREYWAYPEAGLECIVSRRSHRVLSVFLKGDLARKVGLLGASETAIRAMHNEPDLEGGGFMLDNGIYIGRWISYASGIGFHFDGTGRVEMVSVFAAKRGHAERPGIKSGARVGHPLTHSLAALRRS